MAVSTIKSSGGHYSSLAAWEAAKQAVLADTEEAECYDFADTTEVAIAGWTTTATFPIRIYTPPAERHTGIIGTGYRLTNTSTFLPPLTITEENVRVEGIELYANATFSNDDLLKINATGLCDIRVSYCLFNGTAMVNFDGIEGSGAASGTYRIWNNFILKTDGHGINWNVTGGGVLYLYNNSIVGCARKAGGFSGVLRTGGTIIAKNNLVDERTTSGSNSASNAFQGTFDASSTGNLSTDTTDAGTDTINSATPIYVDVANNDIHLGASDTACKNLGVDLSADANLAFADDIDGQTRGVWDIGADEIPEPTIDQEGYRFRNDDGSETTATWKEAQDVDASSDKDLNVRIRVALNAADAPGAKSFQLEAAVDGTSDWFTVKVNNG